MRKSLASLIKDTIIFEYSLPHTEKSLSKVMVSTDEDRCYSASNSEALKVIIYNSIIEYSFNEFELVNWDYQNLHARAVKSKIRYDQSATVDTKVKYGFFGEVLLYSILYTFFDAMPIIARGYFYSPLERSESKGYDAYHLIERDSGVELWFGEVKFHKSYRAGINDVFRKIEKALSDDYLHKNILTIISNHENNLNIKGSMIEKIIVSWKDNPNIVIIDELKKYNAKLIYPVFIVYEGDADYDQSINMVTKYINSKYNLLSPSLSIEYSIFFIFLPVQEVNKIKSDIISWIESKKEPLS